MGARLQAIVDRVRRESRGVVNVDLARLNLRVGQPLSRAAMEIPDTHELVAKAEAVANEILGAAQDPNK
ncbi:MAG: hypothetical protein JNK05_36365 [Myxococcales bacterium]|nr:hypothetical protein [Myxococcales bacterium]